MASKCVISVFGGESTVYLMVNTVSVYLQGKNHTEVDNPRGHRLRLVSRRIGIVPIENRTSTSVSVYAPTWYGVALSLDR